MTFNPTPVIRSRASDTSDSSSKLRVILSTGIGRLHLVQSAQHLARHGVNVTLVQGWVPKNTKSLLVKIATLLTGHRNLAAGLEKRIPSDFQGEIKTCAFADFATNIFFLLSKSFPFVSRAQAARCGWLLFGRQSARHLRARADVFHVRSGAGQGGAIKVARESGLAILVDQSALHPDDIAANTDADYRRWGLPPLVKSDEGLWPLVIKDCAEADLVLVNSDQIKASFVSHGFDPDRFAVAYLGVREDFMGLKADYAKHGPLRLLFTGGFSPLKGAQYVLEALRILKDRKINVEMDVVGSTEMATPIISTYADSKLPITFHGHVPQDELKRFLAAADVYVFPSLADGCASSGMEALAAGLCVVATAQSGLPIRDGQTGFIVEKRNAESIANRIEILAGDRSIVERTGRQAYCYMKENHTWDNYCTKTLEAYRACMSRSKVRSSAHCSG